MSPLLVSEGDHALVTNENIAMVLDIAKYGVEETGVIFSLVTPPIYGTLAPDLLITRSDHFFTLQDINQDKVTNCPVINLPSVLINVKFPLKPRLIVNFCGYDDCYDISNPTVGCMHVTIKYKI